MLQMPNTENREKVSALLSLFNQTFAESVRYRDMEWKITAWIVAVLAGVITLPRFALREQAVPTWLRVSLILFSLASCCYGVWHLYYVHSRLTKRRKLYQHCAEILGFYQGGVYDADALFKEKDDTSFWLGWQHLFSWVLLLVAVTTFTVYALVVG